MARFPENFVTIHYNNPTWLFCSITFHFAWTSQHPLTSALESASSVGWIIIKFQFRFFFLPQTTLSNKPPQINLWLTKHHNAAPGLTALWTRFPSKNIIKKKTPGKKYFPSPCSLEWKNKVHLNQMISPRPRFAGLPGAVIAIIGLKSEGWGRGKLAPQKSFIKFLKALNFARKWTKLKGLFRPESRKKHPKR